MSLNIKRLQTCLFEGAPLHPDDPPLVTNSLLVLNLVFFTMQQCVALDQVLLIIAAF